jgi:hypothetical protein
VRATQQGVFKVAVPADAQIKQVTLNGAAGSGSTSGAEAALLLNPGSYNMDVSYVKDWSAGFYEAAPAVSLSAVAHNTAIRVFPSADRWLLWTGGILGGPCVVFWSKLFIVSAICVLCARWRLIGLSQRSAVFLGIGLATLPLIAVGIPLAWLGCLRLWSGFQPWLQRLARWLRLGGFLLLSLIALSIFYHIVETGLVLTPPMLVVGNNSTASTLNWFVDHTVSLLPQPWLISLPLWCWRAFSLLWSTWLVVAVVSWLKVAVRLVRLEMAEG